MSDRDITERLARIETLIDEKVVKEINSLRREIVSVKKVQQSDIDALAALKHKGAGILIGISLTSAAFGITLASLWKQFINLFH